MVALLEFVVLWSVIYMVIKLVRKKLEKDKKISEDDLKQALDKIQKATDDGIAKIDAELKAKEAEVMAV